jgi:hypothetical protein
VERIHGWQGTPVTLVDTSTIYLDCTLNISTMLESTLSFWVVFFPFVFKKQWECLLARMMG